MTLGIIDEGLSIEKPCPRCDYVRKQEDSVWYAETECPKCGVIYAKIEKKSEKTERKPEEPALSSDSEVLEFVQVEQLSAPPPSQNGKQWLKSHGWSHNPLYSKAKFKVVFLWGFAVIWNSVAIPFVIGAIRSKNIDFYWGAAGMTAVGLLVLYHAVRTTREKNRYGTTPLTLDPFPGSIGGEVAGEIIIDTSFDPSLTYTVKFFCAKTIAGKSGSGAARGAGGGTSSHSYAVWQQEGPGAVRKISKGTAVQFRFAVPEGLPCSKKQEYNPNARYSWHLEIQSNHSGIPLERQYEIPVYATAEHSQGIQTSLTSSDKDKDKLSPDDEFCEKTEQNKMVKTPVMVLVSSLLTSAAACYYWHHNYVHEAALIVFLFISFITSTVAYRMAADGKYGQLQDIRKTTSKYLTGFSLFFIILFFLDFFPVTGPPAPLKHEPNPELMALVTPLPYYTSPPTTNKVAAPYFSEKQLNRMVKEYMYGGRGDWHSLLAALQKAGTDKEHLQEELEKKVFRLRFVAVGLRNVTRSMDKMSRKGINQYNLGFSQNKVYVPRIQNKSAFDNKPAQGWLQDFTMAPEHLAVGRYADFFKNLENQIADLEKLGGSIASGYIADIRLLQADMADILEDRQLALQYYLDAYVRASGSRLVAVKGDILQGIVQLLLKDKKLRLAEIALQDAHLFTKDAGKTPQAINLYLQGLVKLYAGDVDIALNFFNNALDNLKEERLISLMSTKVDILLIKSKILIEQDKAKKAKTALTEAKDLILDRIPMHVGRLMTAVMLFEKAVQMTGTPEEAAKWFSDFLKMADGLLDKNHFWMKTAREKIGASF